ncbi:DsrE family protein [Salinilacihabitans rarus]|uniref:DsrE family protein n=1 Tax=Salinilacihabitans rarus TaxID=2961596 RepID=UPI0020C857E5|nr:DsrE family protein [Salinilacihabitans rarus]
MQTVFHLIEDDAEKRETALTIAENLTQDDSVEVGEVAVVAQSHGIEPLTADGEGSDHVRSLLEAGVSFKACGNTLDLMDLDEADLVEGVEPVSSGAGELTRLQSEGYAYVRP